MRSRREPLMIFGLLPFARGHRADDGLGVVQVPVVDLREQLFVLRGAWHHAEQVLDRAELAQHAELLDEVLEGEPLTGHHPVGHRRGLIGVERLLRLLDQAEHVTHVQDARGHPVRVEHVEVGQLLAGGREHDRLAGQRRDRQRRATAGVTVQLGQHHAVVAHAVEEGLRGRHRVLADHRVDDEQHLVGLDRVPDRGGLRHHLLVDAEAARGVDDHDVVQRPARLVERLPRHGDGIADAAARFRSVHRDARLPPDHLQLVHGVRPLQVGGHEQRRVALLLEPQRELAGQRGLTGTLQARQHDHGRRHLGEPQPPGLAAEDLDELLVHDLDDLLRGLSACDTSAPLARSFTRAMNCLTTGSATSASSRAMRISRAVASMSAGDSRPLPRNWEKTWVNRSESVSNTLPGYRAQGVWGDGRGAWGAVLPCGGPQTLSRKE